MISRTAVEQIAQDPRKYLRQCYRLGSRIKVKHERINRLYQVSTQITSAAKAVSAYTGPTDKIGNCVLEIVSLQDEIAGEVNELLAAQREIERAIRELVPDTVQQSILEARYVANMSWEQIAYEFHYAYRWTLRLQQRGISAMQAEAKRRLTEWQDQEKT